MATSASVFFRAMFSKHECHLLLAEAQIFDVTIFLETHLFSMDK